MLATVVSLSMAIWMTGQSETRSQFDDQPMSVDRIVSGIMKAGESQRSRLGPYTVIRRYTVRNRHLKRDAVLEVLWTYEPGKGKSYKVVSNRGASGLTKRALMKVLKAEAENSRRPDGDDPSRISPDHYQFDLAAHGEAEYKIRLTPRRKSKYLLAGYAVVVRPDSAIVRVEGRTSNRLSFWVSEADVVQEFANHRGFWLPERTRSSAKIRFVGTTELTIQAGEYHF